MRGRVTDTEPVDDGAVNVSDSVTGTEREMVRGLVAVRGVTTHGVATGVTTRISELPSSITSRPPSRASKTTPRGLLKLALSAAPLADPVAPLPAMTVVVPEAIDTDRTRLLARSATYSSPVAQLPSRPPGCGVAVVTVLSDDEPKAYLRTRLLPVSAM